MTPNFQPKLQDRFHFPDTRAYPCDEIFTVERIENGVTYCSSSKFPDHTPINFDAKSFAILGPKLLKENERPRRVRKMAGEIKLDKIATAFQKTMAKHGKGLVKRTREVDSQKHTAVSG